MVDKYYSRLNSVLQKRVVLLLSATRVDTIGRSLRQVSRAELVSRRCIKEKKVNKCNLKK